MVSDLPVEVEVGLVDLEIRNIWDEGYLSE